MLPPIEFFMGMFAGGILSYLIAIFVGSGSEAAASSSASSRKKDLYDPSAAGAPCKPAVIPSVVSRVMLGDTTNSGGCAATSQPTRERSNRTEFRNDDR
jgi:hypothetical protein